MESSNLDPVLIGVLLASLGVLLYRLADPEGSLIFDETYYVQDARVILGQAVTSQGLPGQNILSGCDPNSEHPPLPKLIMALGISLFGGNALGWRLPSVFLGLLGVLCLYGIVRTLGGSRGQARLAAFVLAFDNLYFVHSRIATLDIYLTSFALLGAYLYFRRRYELSGIAFGLATVCKINGMLWIFGLFLYESLSYWMGSKAVATEAVPATRRSAGVRGFVLTSVFWLAFAYSALGMMDCYFTEFRGPVSHVAHIFKFGTSLARPTGVGPQGAESTPLHWWMNEKDFDYLNITTSLNDVNTTVVRFRGCMSIYLIGAAPFVLAFCASQARKGSRLGLWVVCAVFANYVPFLVTWIKAHRICYIFYMVPNLPLLAAGIGLAGGVLPRWFPWVFALGTVYTFVALFPFPLTPALQ